MELLCSLQVSGCWLLTVSWPLRVRGSPGLPGSRSYARRAVCRGGHAGPMRYNIRGCFRPEKRNDRPDQRCDDSLSHAGGLL